MSTQNIVVLGVGGVGKSALTVQFVRGSFVAKYDPTIEDSYCTHIVVDSVHQRLEILDTAGSAQDQFAMMRNMHLKIGDGFVLVYSITSPSSFKEISSLREEILLAKKGAAATPMVLIGNKCDMVNERAVTRDQGEALAREFGSTFLESSAKSNVNVEPIFHDLVRQIQISRNNAGEKLKRRSRQHRNNCSLL
jgi:small GTP-binding protein